jgi:kumamolisin
MKRRSRFIKHYTNDRHSCNTNGFRVKKCYGCLNSYFAQLGIPKPMTSSVAVDGGHNHPTGNPNGPDGEVMLDIEVAGVVAPGARIAVYFAPNTTRGLLDAITTAIHDRQRSPSVISISWGGPEPTWTPRALQAYDRAFQEAALLGVTVCCASGDNGSSDGVGDGLAHVDFPASSPFALGCGGTRLEASKGAITRESVWNGGATGGATGGGISEFFPLPPYQTNTNIPAPVNPGGLAGRGVPDVAGDADPGTGYQILVDGQRAVFGGTSAVAPLSAGLIALINQKLGKPVGFLNPLLYGQLATAGVLHDITSGNNGDFQAREGWDACTGLGSPDGAKLLSALAGETEVSSVAATANPTK